MLSYPLLKEQWSALFTVISYTVVAALLQLLHFQLALRSSPLTGITAVIPAVILEMIPVRITASGACCVDHSRHSAGITAGMASVILV